jgi:hypothetical protein
MIGLHSWDLQSPPAVIELPSRNSNQINQEQMIGRPVFIVSETAASLQCDGGRIALANNADIRQLGGGPLSGSTDCQNQQESNQQLLQPHLVSPHAR